MPDGVDAPRVLTVQQPWASLIVSGLKPVENRSWRTPYRGPLLIHAAALRYDDEGERRLRRAGLPLPPAPARLPGQAALWSRPLSETLPRGCIVGRVILTDCVRDFDSPWAERGAWHWLLSTPEPAIRPLRCKGALNLSAPPTEWQRAFSSITVADLDG
jgi:hypothetical protein